jgi:hypothetical protein
LLVDGERATDSLGTHLAGCVPVWGPLDLTAFMKGFEGAGFAARLYRPVPALNMSCAPTRPRISSEAHAGI